MGRRETLSESTEDAASDSRSRAEGPISVLVFVNGGTATSFPIEMAAAVDRYPEFDVSIAFFYDGSLDDADPDVAELDLDLHFLDARSRVDFRAFRRLRGLLDDVDVLHTHYNAVGSLGRLASVGTNVAVVNTEHNDHHHFSLLQNTVNAVTHPLSDVTIFNSESTRQSIPRYEQLFLRRSGTVVVHNGIDLDRIERGLVRDDIPDLPDGPLVLTACRIDEQKDVPTLVGAMEHVLTEQPDAHLVVVGDGSRRPAAENVAEQRGITDSVTFLGYLPEREQVYGVMHECDLFVVTSIYEGFCNAAVEAMACGLPVVASDIRVLREVLDEGARFAPPGDEAAFAEEITTLLADDSDREALASAAIERAHTRFPIERTAAGYRDVYRYVVTGGDNHVGSRVQDIGNEADEATQTHQSDGSVR